MNWSTLELQVTGRSHIAQGLVVTSTVQFERRRPVISFIKMESFSLRDDGNSSRPSKMKSIPCPWFFRIIESIHLETCVSSYCCADIFPYRTPESIIAHLLLHTRKWFLFGIKRFQQWENKKNIVYTLIIMHLQCLSVSFLVFWCSVSLLCSFCSEAEGQEVVSVHI